MRNANPYRWLRIKANSGGTTSLCSEDSEVKIQRQGKVELKLKKKKKSKTGKGHFSTASTRAENTAKAWSGRSPSIRLNHRQLHVWFLKIELKKAYKNNITCKHLLTRIWCFLRLIFKLLNSTNNYFSYMPVTMTTFNLMYKMESTIWVCTGALKVATASLILRANDVLFWSIIWAFWNSFSISLLLMYIQPGLKIPQ